MLKIVIKNYIKKLFVLLFLIQNLSAVVGSTLIVRNGDSTSKCTPRVPFFPAFNAKYLRCVWMQTHHILLCPFNSSLDEKRDSHKTKV